MVFAIGALVVGLAPVAYGKLRESTEYRDTLRAFLSDLRWARQQAVVQGAETRFQVNLAAREFGVQGRPTHQLPSSLQVRATVGGAELTPDQVAGVLFLADGGATGGSFDIVRASGVGTRVRVDWLSGRVEQEAIGP